MADADGKDDWVTAPAASAAGKDDWVTAPHPSVNSEGTPINTPAWGLGSGSKAPPQDAPKPGAEDAMTNTVNVGPMMGRIAGAAGRGAAEGFGNEPLGLSPQNEEGLVKAGVYNAPDEYNPLKGINKAVIGGVSAAGDLALRAGNALFRGGQAAVAQTGEEVGAPQLGRDIAAIPEAFMGSPDMLGHAAKPATITAREVQARDGVGIMEAWQRAHTENTAAAIADIGKAPDIDSAIAAAGKAAEAPGADAFPQIPLNADEAGRAAAMGDQAAASMAPDGTISAPADAGTPGATPFEAQPKEPKRLIQFLREPTTQFPGTVHAVTTPGGILDVGGDVGAAIGGPKGRPGLINNRNGRSLDDATLNAWQAGYFPDHDVRPEINDLLNAIRDDHTGNAQYSMHDQADVDSHQYAKAHNEEISRIASQTGIDPAGKTRDQFFDAVSQHLSAEDADAAQIAADHSLSDDYADFEQNAAAHANATGNVFDPSSFYGSDQSRSLKDLENEHRQEVSATDAQQRAISDAQSGSPGQPAGASQAGSGQGGSVAGPTGRNSAQADLARQPAPQSVGAAAASRDTTALTAFGRTAREIKGQQADMELADLMRTPQPGDARDIVPGATQTRSEIEQNPSVSLEAKGLRQEFRDGFNEHEKENNDVYHRYIDDVVPTAEMRGTMADIREAKWQANEEAAFGGTPNEDLFNAGPHGATSGANPNGQPVSTAPVVKHLLDVLSKPVEKYNSYLKKEFKPFLDAMTDDKGKPIVIGAKELYGIRQEMGRKVKDMATNTDLAHVRGQFGDLMKATDDAITAVAPKYRDMMDQYRQDSIPINAAERLGDMPLKITNGSDRVITFGNLDRYMKALWAERNGPNPYAKAKDIPQETWDHLMLLHERLARSASSKELAKAQGSDTSQMLMELGRKGMIGAAHGVVGHLTGGLGNIAIPIITKQIDHARAVKRVDRELHPNPSRYPNPGP